MAWHLEAVGSQGQRGTGDPKTMDARGVPLQEGRRHLERDGLLEVRVPAHRQGRLADDLQDQVRMADLLYFQQKWAECGPAFDAVVAENPKAPEAAEAAYASVLCYQNIYDASTQKGGRQEGQRQPSAADEDKKSARPSRDDEAKFKPKDMTDDQKGMISPSTATSATSTRPRTTQTGRSSSSRSSTRARAPTSRPSTGRRRRVAFRDIAMNHSDKRRRHLRRAALPREHQRPRRPHVGRRTAHACFDDMIDGRAEVHRALLHRRQDGEERGAVHASSTKIQCDIQRLKAREARRGAPTRAATTRSSSTRRAADAYFDLWQKYGETPLRNDQQPAVREAATRSSRTRRKAFQAGRLVAKAIRRA